MGMLDAWRDGIIVMSSEAMKAKLPIAAIWSHGT